MIFSSPIFLFIFLPIFFGIYYLTPSRFRNIVILVGSYIFYAWWRVDFLLLFVAVTLCNFIVGNAIYQALSQHKQNRAKHWLICGLVIDLGTLGYFKYADFGIQSLNALLDSMGSAPLPLAHVILPIGISFYIFQAVSYLIDVYRKDTPPTTHFIDFAAFIALFPQLIAGPVLRYKDLAHQFSNREHSWALFSAGVALFMKGFIKKVLIADSVAPIADSAFGLSNPSLADAWLGTLAYTVQLYFDFSGYSDMAVGLGLMMGFRFINNFNQPYISQSITEFWRRWHISLSTWLRDYLYIPLGGNRHGLFNTYRNLILTMLLGGLWHGANWTFVVWGAWHGIWLAIEKATGRNSTEGFSVTSWLATALIVMLGWVVFRAENIHQAFTLYQALFIPERIPMSQEMHENNLGWSFIMLLVGGIIILWRGLSQHISGLNAFNTHPNISHTLSAIRLPVFVLAVSSLIASSYSPFLYFQF